MKLSGYLLVVLTLAPAAAWSEGLTSGGLVDQMLKHQQSAELLDVTLSRRLEKLAVDRNNIQNQKARECLNDAMDQRASVKKRISDGLLVRAAIEADTGSQDELDNYRRVASRIFYAAARDMEAALSQLNKCVSDR